MGPGCMEIARIDETKELRCLYKRSRIDVVYIKLCPKQLGIEGCVCGPEVWFATGDNFGKQNWRTEIIK